MSGRAEELSSGEEEEEEEESEEEEERPAPAPKQKQQKEQQQQGAKRPAPAVAAAAAKTPQPAKKAKVEQQQKAPATAPAKVPAAKPAAAAAAGTPGPAAPANEKEYLAALKAALQQGGALKLATVRARGCAASGRLHLFSGNFWALCCRALSLPALHSCPMLIPTTHSDCYASLLSCFPPRLPACSWAPR